MIKKINLIFMGGFTYPHGMAATKRIQNTINAIKECSDVEMRVILQRQSSQENNFSGVHEGTPYETVMGDLFRVKLFVSLPILYSKTKSALKRAYQLDKENVIYFYGPLFIDSVIPLKYAKKLGYKIVFDVIEDFGQAKGVSYSFFHYLRIILADMFSTHIKRLASGIIVISSYLENQCRELTQGKTPLHYMSVSVDMNLFPEKPSSKKSMTTFFYAGSFGKKDGILILLDAFDKLAEKHENIFLALTGRGDSQAMDELLVRVEKSPYKARIDYKGYLNDRDYNVLLNDVDILCMTRVDLAFANAGFPFKLGEFLATGKPVIASRVSDVGRFLSDRENAMLVKAGSSDEVCKAAEFLLADPKAARTIGEKGRKVANKSFNNKQQGKDLLAFIRVL